MDSKGGAEGLTSREARRDKFEGRCGGIRISETIIPKLLQIIQNNRKSLVFTWFFDDKSIKKHRKNNGFCMYVYGIFLKICKRVLASTVP